MRDLNFFEPYIEKKNERTNTINKEIIFYFSITLVIIVTAIYSVSNAIRVRKLNRETLLLKEKVEDEGAKEEVKYTENKEKELKRQEEIVTGLNKADEKITSMDKIDNAILEKITDKMPDNLFLTSININPSSIEISGNSKNRYLIADFERGLNEIKDFKSIFISDISSRESYYNFTLNIQFEGVKNSDGEKSTEGTKRESHKDSSGEENSQDELQNKPDGE